MGAGAGRPQRPEVDFYFDVVCPWCYFALERLHEAALRNNARIRYRPVLWFELERQLGFPVQLSAARQRYDAKDMGDWARFLGLPLALPVPAPVVSEAAQCAVAAALEQGKAKSFLDGLFRLTLAVGRPPDEAAIAAAAAEADLDATAFQRARASSGTAAVLRQNSADLLAVGGFGVPTMVVGNDLYFGNDRMPLVEAAMARASGMRLVLPGFHGSDLD
jgi:2-hydroxychromene-2-carboxylate isomerase